jgi:hypothetical protein
MSIGNFYGNKADISKCLNTKDFKNAGVGLIYIIKEANKFLPLTVIQRIQLKWFVYEFLVSFFFQISE